MKTFLNDNDFLVYEFVYQNMFKYSLSGFVYDV
jgi:hypothetical protein